MNHLPFIKMHGCGNDYVFVDAMVGAFADSQHIDFAALARRVSDRHRSIGGDGLVLMQASDDGAADARMRMFNSDGSEGTLCGNALRCMAMWLHQTGRCGTNCRIAMHDRIIDSEVRSFDSARKQANVCVAVGSPVEVFPAASGLQRFIRHITLPDVTLRGQPLQLTVVSMGNPHAVVLVEDVMSVSIETLGPQIERHPEFPNRTNVEFVQVVGADSAIVRIWERGSGETLACGSGACAIAVAGWAAGLFTPNTSVRIRSTGGDLIVHISTEHVVSLEGPAEESFRGLIDVALLPDIS